MIVEYIRYTVPAERCGEFEEAYAKAAGALEQDEHCLAHEVARCVEDPHRYVVRLEWDSIDGHEQGFRGGAQFAPFLQAVGPFVKQIDEMRHYALAGNAWRREP